VHAGDRGDHDVRHRGGSKRREQAESEQETADGFGQTEKPGVESARPEAKRLEEPRSGGRAVATKEASPSRLI
jgi:hypothetical protein